MPMTRLHMMSCMAAVLLAGCAARKTVHVPAPVEVAKPTVPAAATPPSKPRAEKKPVNATAEKNTALPAREVGYYLDVLQGRLQQRLDPGVIVGRERGSIVLDFSRRFTFAADSTQLDEIERTVLLPLAKVLGEYRAALVSVRVSADSDAMAARKLAQQRATAVARALTDAGVAAARIVAVVPSAAAHGADARVEIVLAAETRGD
jgi:outer membrane protein OmpA-like peptidoglycan-associated protein